MRSFLFIVIVTALSLGCQKEVVEPESVIVLRPEYINPGSSSQIVEVTDSLVQPIIYASIPSLEGLTVEETKSKFISAVLPSILVAKYQIEEDRLLVLHLDSTTRWSKDDSVFIAKQSKRFGTSNLEDLADRMETHPNSIVLAQAIVESGWGSSRFFQNANNLFGIWSYSSKESRMLAGKTRNGEKIYVRKYDDLSASIVDYFGTMARVRAYRKFRAARLETEDVNELLPYLKYYCERGDEYVAQLATIIRQNKLMQYDNYQIDPAYFVEETLAME